MSKFSGMCLRIVEKSKLPFENNFYEKFRVKFFVTENLSCYLLGVTQFFEYNPEQVTPRFSVTNNLTRNFS